LAAPAQRGPVTLVPSISVSEEYNDNVFLDNTNRQSDFITGFSPALTLLVVQPRYEINAGYSFTSEIFAKETTLSGPFNRQTFLGTALFRATPALRLMLSDTFLYDRNTGVTAQGPTIGRQKSWSNTGAGGATWEMTPLSYVSVSGSYAALRFLDSGPGLDSGTYTFQSTLGYAFTPRFTGTLGYNFTFLALQNQQDSATHNPTVGFVYRFTRTLTGEIKGGPAITQIAGTTSISPAGTANLTQTFSWGSLRVDYTRGVSVAGGFGGTTDSQTLSGTLAVSQLRGFFFGLSPSYTKSDSVSSAQVGQVDVQTFTLSLAALYQIARYINVFVGYTFLHQHTGGTSSFQADVDQNRVRAGVQFGYPINFD
jgi:hypothetical protein